MAHVWHNMAAASLLAPALVGCGGKSVEDTAAQAPTVPDAPPTAVASGQTLLFEVHYVNFAWGIRSAGVYVTAQGDVFSFDGAGMPADAGLPSIRYEAPLTESRIMAGYGPSPQKTKTVDLSVLEAKFALVGSARRGALVSGTVCADAGVTRYGAFIYDTETSTYTPVTLAEDGDTWTWNTEPDAAVLVKWLDTLGASTLGSTCPFGPDVCTGQPCPDAPACAAGEVPAKLDSARGCLTTCSKPGYCADVADCGACAPLSLACVTDLRGGKHCTIPTSSDACPRTSDTASQTLYACDCAGDTLCAGGKDACRGTSVDGFACGAP